MQILCVFNFNGCTDDNANYQYWHVLDTAIGSKSIFSFLKLPNSIFKINQITELGNCCLTIVTLLYFQHRQKCS